ncbi:hypothetical protein BH11BAC6_BH11BAC6_12170 [soil metagenome]
MRNIVCIILLLNTFTACSEKQHAKQNDVVIGNGQMPNITRDRSNAIHIVYGSGDSIMYATSTDNANTFSQPALIAVLPGVYTFATRGPQIAATAKGIVVTACTSAGNIYAFYKEDGSTWQNGVSVNDVDSIAKEGLMALSADGNNAFAVWLDLRANQHNKIYGAASNDGGKTWSKNIMVYTSPDTSVCECCKPSVVVKGNNVYVMFRNWLQGNRDLYLTQSGDNGNTFATAQKLGEGNWKLNGCPMDGGSIAINGQGKIETVWRREGKVYTSIPGMPEKEIGEGKGCVLETTNNKTVYAWVENGEVVVVNAKGEKKILGKGNQPMLKALNNEQFICVWENEKQIHASVFEL